MSVDAARQRRRAVRDGDWGRGSMGSQASWDGRRIVKAVSDRTRSGAKANLKEVLHDHCWPTGNLCPTCPRVDGFRLFPARDLTLLLLG